MLDLTPKNKCIMTLCFNIDSIIPNNNKEPISLHKVYNEIASPHCIVVDNMSLISLLYVSIILSWHFHNDFINIYPGQKTKIYPLVARNFNLITNVPLCLVLITFTYIEHRFCRIDIKGTVMREIYSNKKDFKCLHITLHSIHSQFC